MGSILFLLELCVSVFDCGEYGLENQSGANDGILFRSEGFSP